MSGIEDINIKDIVIDIQVNKSVSEVVEMFKKMTITFEKEGFLSNLGRVTPRYIGSQNNNLFTVNNYGLYNRYKYGDAKNPDVIKANPLLEYQIHILELEGQTHLRIRNNMQDFFNTWAQMDDAGIDLFKYLGSQFFIFLSIGIASIIYKCSKTLDTEYIVAWSFAFMIFLSLGILMLFTKRPDYEKAKIYTVIDLKENVEVQFLLKFFKSTIVS